MKIQQLLRPRLYKSCLGNMSQSIFLKVSWLKDKMKVCIFCVKFCQNLCCSISTLLWCLQGITSYFVACHLMGEHKSVDQGQKSWKWSLIQIWIHTSHFQMKKISSQSACGEKNFFFLWMQKDSHCLSHKCHISLITKVPFPYIHTTCCCDRNVIMYVVYLTMSNPRCKKLMINNQAIGGRPAFSRHFCIKARKKNCFLESSRTCCKSEVKKIHKSQILQNTKYIWNQNDGQNFEGVWLSRKKNCV